MRHFVLTIAILGSALLLTVALALQVRHTPRFETVRAGYLSSDRAILDRNGQVVDEVRLETGVRRLNWVRLSEVPAVLVDVLLQSEDKLFHYHPGLDPLARGAGGTISMQLSALLEPSSGQLSHMWKTLVLEAAWNKREILEAYFNLTVFRGELQGIAAASLGLLDKPPADLTLAESALLVALIHAPNASLAQAQGRACQLLRKMKTPEDCASLSARHLNSIEQGYSIRPFARLAPHMARHLAAMTLPNSGSLVRSTLDRQIQWVAMVSLQTQIASLQSQSSSDGAVVVIENDSGNVLAYVGNTRAGNKTDAALDPHPAGSTLKPFLYAKAIDERILTAATRLEDISKPVTTRAALSADLNLPAVKTLELLGVETFLQTMTELGFTNLERPEVYGPTLALSTADVRLVELTNAYRTLVNGGMWSPLHYSPDQLSEVSAQRVFSPAAAFVITEMLIKPGALWTALKSGDNWCVGFSEKYTVGVWTAELSAAQGATPVWQEVMGFLHGHEASRAPDVPRGLVKRNEWFLSGTEPSRRVISRIAYPKNHDLIALDSVLKDRRLFFQIVAPQTDQNLYLNGHRLGLAQPFQAWEPHSGKYKLELRDSQGQVIDKIRFEVRGRSVASR